MRRKLIIALMLIMALSTVGFAVACNGENGVNGNNPNISQQVNKPLMMNKYTHEMDLLAGDYTLILQNTTATETAEWSSSNTAVATVKNGVVTPVGVGVTEISAKIGEQTAVCYITVNYNGAVPFLSVGSKNLRLLKNDVYPLNPRLFYNSVDCTDATFKFTSTNTDILTVDNSGNITAVNYGEAQIKVVASWKNVDTEYVTEYVNVLVIRDVKFNFTEPKLELYTLDEFAGIDYGTKKHIYCTATVDGEKVDEKVTFRVEDSSICSYSNYYVHQRARVGKTYLTASVTIDGVEYYDSIEVNVIRPVLEVNDQFFLSRALKDVNYLLDRPDYSAYGASEILQIVAKNGDKETIIDVENNQAKEVGNLENGATSIEIYTEKFGYVYNNAEVVDLYVDSPERVDMMRQMAGSIKDVVLGKDIDMKGYPCTNIYGNQTFTGIFDGRGYTISNMEYKTGTGCSLFQRLTGTVKNLNLKDLLINGVQSGGICMELKGGTIENVYISVNMAHCNTSGGFAKQIVAGDSTIKDSVVNVTSATLGSMNGGLFVSFVNTTSPWSLNVINTYALTLVNNAKLAGREGGNYSVTGKIINDKHTTENPIIYNNVGEFALSIIKGELPVNATSCEIIGITNDNVVPVSTAADLQTMRTTFRDRNKIFVLMNDIILTGDEAIFAPSGTNKFMSTFDGNGHEIRGMILSGTNRGYGTGFFGQVENATIRNVAFTNVTFDTACSNQGVIVAGLLGGLSPSVIDNVFISVDLSKSTGVSGGFASWSSGATKITNSVIVYNSKLAQTTDGLLIGRPGAGSTVDVTGSYAIYADGETNIKLAGDDSKNKTETNRINGLTNRTYSLSGFKAANIDLSNYNAAIKNAVAAL